MTNRLFDYFFRKIIKVNTVLEFDKDNEYKKEENIEYYVVCPEAGKIKLEKCKTCMFHICVDTDAVKCRLYETS